jgi:23S rRNA (pseudouridine1915-N3)-methyltransferase
MYEARLQSSGVSIHTHTEDLEKYLSKLEAMNGQLFLLDEKGSTFTSTEFADKVRAWALGSKDTHFAIGPAEGWSDYGRHLPRISLSEMTFPHEFAAVLFLEQLYRSYQIIKGTSYHKA